MVSAQIYPLDKDMPFLGACDQCGYTNVYIIGRNDKYGSICCNCSKLFPNARSYLNSEPTILADKVFTAKLRAFSLMSATKRTKNLPSIPMEEVASEAFINLMLEIRAGKHTHSIIEQYIAISKPERANYILADRSRYFKNKMDNRVKTIVSKKTRKFEEERLIEATASDANGEVNDDIGRDEERDQDFLKFIFHKVLQTDIDRTKFIRFYEIVREHPELKVTDVFGLLVNEFECWNHRTSPYKFFKARGREALYLIQQEHPKLWTDLNASYGKNCPKCSVRGIFIGDKCPHCGYYYE